MQNTTQITRVSFDVRVAPIELFDGEARGPSKTVFAAPPATTTAGSKPGGGRKLLRLGEYYVECSVNEERQSSDLVSGSP